MSYSYQNERHKIFTEEGQVLFLAVRDAVNKHLNESGAFTISKINVPGGYDSWTYLACFDRLEELGEIKMISLPGTRTQDQPFVRGIKK